ncbi:MAG TPA: cytochrome c oxidase assembly protein [Anaerolineales bacterium]|nr:cytochrome c oxidase assembly protein [Anaerolineales bacterium]
MPEMHWTFYPSVIAGVALWTLGYVLANGPLRKRYGWGAAASGSQQLAFHSGSLILLMALISPLDEIGDHYLFSAHMLQHLLLLFAVSPLWLVGTPGWLPGRMLPRNLLRFARGLTRPLVAATIFGGVTMLWHHPALYSLAQGSEWVHILEHLTYLGAGLIGWWPLAGPETALLPKPSVPIRILYDFSIALPCALLGAILTFAPHPIYASYVAAPRLLGLEALDDQRLAGLLMWIPTYMLLLVVLGKSAARWLQGEDAKPGLVVDELHG